MDAISALLNLNIGRMTIYALVITDTAIGGSLVLFLLWPEWFRELPTLKVLVLAMAITTPFFVFGSLLVALHGRAEAKPKSPGGVTTGDHDRATTREVANAALAGVGGHLIFLMLFLVAIGVDSLETKHGALADHTDKYRHAYWAAQVGYLGVTGLVWPAIGATGSTSPIKQHFFRALFVACTLLPYVAIKLT